MAKKSVLVVAVVVLSGWVAAAEKKVVKEQPMTPGGEWRRHDMNRPRPVVREAGAGTEKEFARPVEGAVVLFDGKDLSQWVRRGGAKDADKSLEPRWKVEKGYMEIVPKSGSIFTKEKFGDCRIHIEWAMPAEVDLAKKGQARGNSGVYLPGHNEVQVLDSYQNDTYADGQAAAIYGLYPPLFNVCRRPGEWQSYDITLEQPRFDAQKKLVRAARVTVVHNGVVVQDRVELPGTATEGVVLLQDHGNAVRYRNVWVKRLTGEEIK